MATNIEKSYSIEGTPDKVWHALTTPEIIKQYFFGTHAVSDWKEGSTIIYRGEWQGKPYEDKGIILKFIPGKLLTINYWSGMTGAPDKPENYTVHSYTLEPQGNTHTRLTIVQEDHYKTDESRGNAWQHWDVAMSGLQDVMRKESVC